MAITKARQLAEFIANADVDSDEIATGAVSSSKLAATLDLSGKTLTFAANQISGNSVDGGVISNFASTGIDDNASSTAVTILSSGNVGIGTASPAHRFHINQPGNSPQLRISGNANWDFYSYNDNNLYVNNASGTVLGLLGNRDAYFSRNLSVGDSVLSTYHTNYPAVDIGSSASVQGYTGNNGAWLQSNLFMSVGGQWTSKSDDYSAMLELYDGNFNFYNTASGTGTRTLLTPMTIRQNGNVGIGTQNPDQKLVVKGVIETEASNSTNGFMMYTYTDNTYRINYNGTGADELILTSGGVLGLGTTPGVWSSNYPALQIGQGATFTGHASNTQTQLGQNWWIGTGNQYVVNGAASRLIMNPDSTIIFSQAPSGTAGAAISATDVFVIDTSGRVGIGTGSGVTTNAHANADDLVIGNTSTRTGMTIVSDPAQSGAIHFSDGTSTGNANIKGQVSYEHGDNSFRFYINGTTEALRLGTSGGTVFNNGQDINQNFTVKASGNANALFIDGNGGQVTIGGGSVQLTGGGVISSNGTSDTLILSGANAEHVGAGITLHGNTHSNASQTWFKAGSTTVMTIAGGNVLVGTQATNGTTDFTSKLIAGTFSTKWGTQNNMAYNTWTTIFTFGNNEGNFMVSARGSGTGNINDNTTGIIHVQASSQTAYAALLAGSRCQLRMSGLALQCNQTIFTGANINWNIIRIST